MVVLEFGNWGGVGPQRVVDLKEDVIYCGGGNVLGSPTVTHRGYTFIVGVPAGAYPHQSLITSHPFNSPVGEEAKCQAPTVYLSNDERLYQ